MPHLLSFRKGWESENLARYLLHKFSFIANPSTISDDIGTDYYCTLFEINKEGAHKYLNPINTFAIQIKSAPGTIDLTEKVQYLERLELPFYLGIVDKEKLSLSFFSGENIPLLFSHHGKPKKLEIKLEMECPKDIEFYSEISPGEYQVIFLFITIISANQTENELRTSVKKILDRSIMMQKNIVSKLNEEYIFKIIIDGKYNVSAYAGMRSVQHFRRNLIERLGEAFNNLNWIISTNPEKFNKEEFKIYESCYLGLKELGSRFGEIPRYIEEYYSVLKKSLDK